MQVHQIQAYEEDFKVLSVHILDCAQIFEISYFSMHKILHVVLAMPVEGSACSSFHGLISGHCLLFLLNAARLCWLLGCLLNYALSIPVLVL